MTLTVISSPYCATHNMGDEHPECPDRLYAINDQLIASGLDYVVSQAQAHKADKMQLYRVHAMDYVDHLFSQSPQYDRIWMDEDTIMMSGTLNAALYAAGAGIDAVDLVMTSASRQVFCNVRPPGHHAERAKAMGFCFFNNIAVAAAYALDRYPCERVAIVDFDVHHGNGTEDIFSNDPRVLFCSAFQHPFYPFKGASNSAANIINVPLSAGTSSDEFRQAVAHWFDAIDDFKPHIILISAGFDAHAEDDLGHFRLMETDFAWITTELKMLALRHCQGRIVSMLEGGYALSALGRSVVMHLNSLIR